MALDRAMAKRELLRIVDGAKGDDLERAERQFRKMSEQEYNAEWGESGRTCRDIVADYRLARMAWQAARALAESIEV